MTRPDPDRERTLPDEAATAAEPAAGPRDPWHAVASSFAALGRVVLLLDSEYHVVRASPQLDRLVCRGTAQRIVGKPVGAMLGSRLFQPGDEVHRALSAGGRVEGRRAFIKCPESGAQLVSVTIAPVPHEDAHGMHPRARFMVVVRASDEPDTAHLAPVSGLMAQAPSMLRIVSLIEALADSEANVLITGETGTGKSAVAAAIHAHSPRSGGPFITVDTGAIPAELLESELFGHVRGAFTGALKDRVGLIELARGGTLFLDEIGDMPLPLQVKLLRLVEEREFRRLGESTPRPMDARIIAATHVDLHQAIAAGRFREDLYYRLCVVPIELPPLRERAIEIEPLARHLLGRIGSAAGRALALGDDARDAIVRYGWPGNVRQLENAIEHAVAVCRGQTIHVEDLPADVRLPRPNGKVANGTARPSPTVEAPARAVPVSVASPEPGPRELQPAPATSPGAAAADESEAARIRLALEAHRWNRSATAQALGMNRSTLWRKLRALGLD